MKRVSLFTNPSFDLYIIMYIFHPNITLTLD